MTRRQFLIVNFILRHQRETGRSPLYREIGQAVGLKSPSDVGKNIRWLQDNGYLAPNGRGSQRALQVLKMPYEIITRYV